MGTSREAKVGPINQRPRRHNAEPRSTSNLGPSGIPVRSTRRVSPNASKGIRITIQGTPGCQIASELAVSSSDAILIKKRYSAFYATTLDQCLTDLRPDGLILAGINTHACIRMTAIDAYQRDWEVILAADCVDSYDREHHEISLRYMRDKIASVMSNEEIRRMFAPST
jgi:nicotinamidase-related amidase